MIALLTAGFAKYGLLAIGALAGFFGVWFAGKKTGKSEAKVEAVQADAKQQIKEAQSSADQQVKAVKNANEAIDENSVLDDASIGDKLRNEWQRD